MTTDDPTTFATSVASQSAPAQNLEVPEKAHSIFTALAILFWLLAVASIFAAFGGTTSLYIIQYFMSKADTGYISFSFLSLTPFPYLLLLITLGCLPICCYSYAALRIKSGTVGAWKTALILLITIVAVQTFVSLILNIYFLPSLTSLVQVQPR